MKFRSLASMGALMALLQASAGEPAGPKAYAVSDAHLDTQWNWDIQTTIRDFIPKTINQNLFLLGQYPDYVFNFEGGVKYAWMKEYYPREYELVKDYIRKGRWHLSGASWDANDVIVPSVESQIRNIMLGQDFYRKEFGTESTDIFLPDCFGFGHTLPSIASHCGLIGFSSQKLGWRNHPFYGDRKYPFTIGLWQGVDGSRIMMVHGYDYNHRWNGDDISSDKDLLRYAAESPLNTVYRYYGTGDTGGSPTVASVVSMEKGLKGTGPLNIISATSDRLYKDYLPYESHPELPVFDGELLMDVHGTGCYTSQAAMKLYNRQNEQLGDAAERAAVMALLYAGAPYPGEALTEGWRRFIWHQFHDDLTGTSIPRAYEFSWNDELLTLKQFSDILTHAASCVASTLDTRTKGEGVVLFNPLGHEVTDIVEISVPARVCPAKAVVKDHTGRDVKAQITGYDGGKATLVVEATLPPVSFAVFDVSLSGKGRLPSGDSNVSTVENSVYRVSFDSNGDIPSIVDKRSGRELVRKGDKIRLALFPENKSYSWPAWEVLKATVDATPVSITDDVKIALVEDGSLRKRVRVSKRRGDSEFVQDVVLYEGEKADIIDFINEVDWATTNALLKAEFPLSVSNPDAVYDLGVGVAQRGVNTLTAYEVPAQQWADLSDASGSYGVTLLNNCKYGWDKPDDNTLRLTLLHTPQTRNSYTYQDHQDFGHHEFTYTLAGHDGVLKRDNAVRLGERANQKIKVFNTPKHSGSAKMLSLVESNVPNLSIKALKRAEDGNGYIVRVYETAGRPAEGELTFALPVKRGWLADGTEKNLSPLAPRGKSLPVSIKPNGIVTMRVELDPAVGATLPEMAAVSLDYDRKGMTWNEFRHNGDFSQGYTYAAELVPETLTYNGIDFSLTPREERNIMSAHGQTVTFPEGDWSKLHILAAAAKEEGDITAGIRLGTGETELTVPSYTGFVGQWGHTGHTVGYVRPQQVAYTGTHRHSSTGDEPYEFTYMYHYALDIPKGVKEVTLPDNPDLAIFAMTVANGEPAALTASAPLFRTAILPASEAGEVAEKIVLNNILTPAMLCGWSGYVRDDEKPLYLVDGDESTKWCDVAGSPAYVDFDMGSSQAIKGWKMVNAAEEDPRYVTSVCYLMGRDNADEEWRTIDCVRGNRSNVVRRTLDEPVSARYLRLLVTTPMQDPTAHDTRIYELEVYD